jgi:thiamine biosynthesis lipoprotein
MSHTQGQNPETPVRFGRRWQVWGVNAHLVLTEPDNVSGAFALVQDELSATDQVASRYRPDSEVRQLAESRNFEHGVSPRLAELINVALLAARSTDGLVDPTVGRDLERLGCPDFSEPEAGAEPIASPLRSGAHATWQDVALSGATLRMPPGTLLDLGATAKAHVVDRCAELVAQRFHEPVLFGLGGDLRAAGPEPDVSWSIFVQDTPSEPSCTITLNGLKAVATSSTLHRQWVADGRRQQHLIDPVTGRSATPIWRTCTVAAPTCLTANTWSTAAMVSGPRAPGLLTSVALPSRLVGPRQTVSTFGGWPE